MVVHGAYETACYYQVRFALSSAGNWSRTDKVTDSENFYYSLLEALDDPANAPHATEILVWWDK